MGSLPQAMGLESLPPWRRWVRRLGRFLWVMNPAAAWLFLREGRRRALAYLQHSLMLYDTRDALLFRSLEPLWVPKVAVEKAFPGLSLERIEVFHPLPRLGGVSMEELVILCALVRHLRPRRILEVGVAEGRTTLNLAFHSPPEAEIVGLDLPPEAPPAVEEQGADYRQMGLARPGLLLEGHPWAAKVRLVLADSTRIDWRESFGAFDFIFIDGAHDYASVRRDSENALRTIAPGGVIVWHDYGRAQGVTRCLNELHRSYPLVWLGGVAFETTLAVWRSASS